MSAKGARYSNPTAVWEDPITRFTGNNRAKVPATSKDTKRSSMAALPRSAKQIIASNSSTQELLWVGIKSVNTRVVIGNELDNPWTMHQSHNDVIGDSLVHNGSAFRKLAFVRTGSVGNKARPQHDCLLRIHAEPWQCLDTMFPQLSFPHKS